MRCVSFEGFERHFCSEVPGLKVLRKLLGAAVQTSHLHAVINRRNERPNRSDLICYDPSSLELSSNTVCNTDPGSDEQVETFFSALPSSAEESRMRSFISLGKSTETSFYLSICIAPLLADGSSLPQ